MVDYVDLSLPFFIFPRCGSDDDNQSLILITDVAFLISNHFKDQRHGGSDWDSRLKGKGTADVLYSELGGKKVDA